MNRLMVIRSLAEFVVDDAPADWAEQVAEYLDAQGILINENDTDVVLDVINLLGFHKDET